VFFKSWKNQSENRKAKEERKKTTKTEKTVERN
jgi:hypothetical protein